MTQATTTLTRAVTHGGLSRCFHTFPHFFAGFEMRYIFRGYENRFSALWFSPFAWWTVVQTKTSKPTDFNSITLDQCISEGIDNLLDGNFCVFRHQAGESGGKDSNKVSTGHE